MLNNPDVPIIGAPKVGEDWFIVLPISCGNCKTHFLLAGQVGVQRACPTCGWEYKLAGLPQAADPLNVNKVAWPIGTRPAQKKVTT